MPVQGFAGDNSDLLAVLQQIKDSNDVIAAALTTNNLALGSPGAPGADVMSTQGVSGGYPMAVVGPGSITSTFSFNRHSNTTQITAGDAIAQDTNPANVTPILLTVSRANDVPFKLHNLILTTSDTTVKAMAVANTPVTARLVLFRALPSFTSGDNDPFSATRANWIGALDVVLSKAFSDGAGGIGLPVDGVDILNKPVSGGTGIYALLRSMTGGWTPQASSNWSGMSTSISD